MSPLLQVCLDVEMHLYFFPFLGLLTLLVEFAGKTLRDGIPPLLQTITKSSASIPPEAEHASCKRSEDPNFRLFKVPEKVWNGANRLWDPVKADGKLRYSTESDIVGRVHTFLENILKASDVSLELSTNLGIRHITPDICVLTMGKSPRWSGGGEETDS